MTRLDRFGDRGRLALKATGLAALVSGLGYGAVRLEGYLWRRSFRDFRLEG